MKIILLALAMFNLILIDGRLVTTEATRVTVDRTVVVKPTRIVRNAFDDDSLTGISNEDSGMSSEALRNIKSPRYLYRPESVPKTIQPNTRIARKSSDNKTKTVTVNNTIIEIKDKIVLVKKPIPKFNDIDYENEFELKLNRAPPKIADSCEHEDEDFNVDDYDFDVNHDEFIGRGKPLEPRNRLKENNPQNTPKISQKEPIRHTDRSIMPVTQVKKQKSIIKKSVNNKKVDDYDYDDVSSTPTPKRKRKIGDESEEDDDEDTKENSRSVRSPWDFSAYVEKFKDKFLSIVPLFPQAASNGNGEMSPLVKDKPFFI